MNPNSANKYQNQNSQRKMTKNSNSKHQISLDVHELPSSGKTNRRYEDAHETSEQVQPQSLFNPGSKTSQAHILKTIEESEKFTSLSQQVEEITEFLNELNQTTKTIILKQNSKMKEL